MYTIGIVAKMLGAKIKHLRQADLDEDRPANAPQQHLHPQADP